MAYKDKTHIGSSDNWIKRLSDPVHAPYWSQEHSPIKKSWDQASKRSDYSPVEKTENYQGFHAPNVQDVLGKVKYRSNEATIGKGRRQAALMGLLSNISSSIKLINESVTDRGLIGSISAEDAKSVEVKLKNMSGKLRHLHTQLINERNLEGKNKMILGKSGSVVEAGKEAQSADTVPSQIAEEEAGITETMAEIEDLLGQIGDLLQKDGATATPEDSKVQQEVSELIEHVSVFVSDSY